MKIEEMWEVYNKGSNKNECYTAWHFCDNEKDADELSPLELEGVKKATSRVYELSAWSTRVLEKGSLGVFRKIFAKAWS